MNRFRFMAIQNYTRRLTAAILDLVRPEVAPFDPPTSKTLHEVDRMTRCWDMAVRNFPKCDVGRSSVLNIYIDFMYSSSVFHTKSQEQSQVNSEVKLQVFHAQVFHVKSQEKKSILSQVSSVSRQVSRKFSSQFWSQTSSLSRKVSSNVSVSSRALSFFYVSHKFSKATKTATRVTL